MRRVFYGTDNWPPFTNRYGIRGFLGADYRIRTDDLSLTRRLHYHCAKSACAYYNFFSAGLSTGFLFFPKILSQPSSNFCLSVGRCFEPFPDILTSLCLVEETGIEPATYCLQSNRSPNWATPPNHYLTSLPVRSTLPVSYCSLRSWYCSSVKACQPQQSPVGLRPQPHVPFFICSTDGLIRYFLIWLQRQGSNLRPID